MLKKVMLVAALAIGSLSYGQGNDRLKEINSKYGFNNMSSEQIREMLYSEDVEKWKSYVEYRSIINSLPKVDEWKDWKVVSYTKSNIGGHFSTLTVYSKKINGKTKYISVSRIDGVEKSRTESTFDF